VQLKLASSLSCSWGPLQYEQILPIVISINKYLLESISKDEIELLDSILERMQQQANKLDMRGLPLANRRSGSSRFKS
jgi:hypothetical protein